MVDKESQHPVEAGAGEGLSGLRVQADGADVCFAVRVVPRASRTRIQGLQGDALKVSLSAPPVDGAANDALIRLIAKTLGVARGQVSIEAGDHGRNKRLRVRGFDAATLTEKLLP